MNILHVLVVTFLQQISFGWAENVSPVKIGTSGESRVKIQLLHAFSHGNNWKPRGSITVTSKDVIAIETHHLSDDELSELKKVSSQNGLYFFKGTVKNSDGTEKSASTVTKACAIYESSLSEVISVTLDLNGNFMSIAIAGTNPSCIPDQSSERKKSSSFNTTVVIGQQVIGPIPDTQTYIQRLEQEKSERLRGDKQDNRSFLAKYWIYIVPLVIFMIVSSATNPEAGGA